MTASPSLLRSSLVTGLRRLPRRCDRALGRRSWIRSPRRFLRVRVQSRGREGGLHADKLLGQLRTEVSCLCASRPAPVTEAKLRCQASTTRTTLRCRNAMPSLPRPRASCLRISTSSRPPRPPLSPIRRLTKSPLRLSLTRSTAFSSTRASTFCEIPVRACTTSRAIRSRTSRRFQSSTFQSCRNT